MRLNSIRNSGTANLCSSGPIHSMPLDRFHIGFMAGIAAGTAGSLTVLVAILLVLGGSGLISTASGQSADTRKELNEQQATASGERPIGEIRRDVMAFVKRSKRSEDPLAAVGAVVDLCQLHYEIVNDRRFATNDQLKGFRAITANRLKKYRRELEVDIKRRDRQHKKSKKLASHSASNQPSLKTESSTKELADGLPATEASEAYDEGLENTMADDVFALCQFSGGPLTVWGNVGGQFAPPWDHGPELVDLIQSTIDPEFWQSGGGDGVIYYYRPLRILVVSASSRVHDDLTNMLENLRRMGR